MLSLLTACGRLGFNGGDAPTDAMRSSDAAAADGATDFCTPSLTTSCPAGAVFCEDFETSTGASFPKWDSVSIKNWYTNGAADPTTSMQANGAPCRGATAAHAHTLGEAQVAFLHKSAAGRPNPFYVRLWFRIAGSSPTSNFELIGLHDSADGNFINIGVDRSLQVFGVNIVGFSSNAAGMTGPAALAADRWSCFEMGVLFDSSTIGRIQLWLDDVPSLDAQNVVTSGTLALDKVVLGVVTGMPETGTFDVEIDEIAISGSRIGCSN